MAHQVETPRRYRPLQHLVAGSWWLLLLIVSLFTTPLSWTEDSAINPDGVTLPASVYAPLLKTETLTLSLADVLTRIQTDNLYIQQQQTQVGIARANFALKLIDPLPSVNASYTLTDFDGVIQLFGSQTIPVKQTVHEPRIDASLTVGLGGKQLWNILQARRDVQASKALLAGTLQQQLATATRNFYTWQEAHLIQQAASTALNAANEDVRSAEKRYQAGVGTKLAVMQSQAQQALRQQERFASLKQVAVAEETLLNQLNLPITTRLQPAQLGARKIQLIHGPAIIETNVDWLSQLLQHHPEMERLDKEERALRWQSRSILSTVLPDVTVSAYRGGRGPQLNNLGRITGAALSVQTSLGNKLGLELPAEYIGARRLTKAKQTEIGLARRNLQSQVMQALLESQRAEHTITAAQARKQSAKEAYRLAQARQTVGVGTTLDTLTAATDHSQAMANAATAVMDYNRAQVDLLEALGQVTPQSLNQGIHLDSTGQLQPPPTKNSLTSKKDQPSS